MNPAAIQPVVGLIIPCFNENESLPGSLEQLSVLFDELIFGKVISPDSFIAIVDDRSMDNTWETFKGLRENNPRFRGIRLASNKGHQYALLAGLLEFHTRADCLISLDADLQDDIGIMETMIRRFGEGNEIVYGVRKKRYKDSLFKRGTALFFYRLLRLMGVKAVYNHADYRLTSRKVIEELANYNEINLYLRGLFPLIGFNSCIVYYDRKERIAGKTKYPLGRMISLALDGITSFSIIPLRIISILGFFVFLICLCLMGYALDAYFQHKTIAGWFSTVLPFYFLGGIQILCIGIIGEYLGKIYKEVKRRPRYTIDEKI